MSVVCTASDLCWPDPTSVSVVEDRVWLRNVLHSPLYLDEHGRWSDKGLRIRSGITIDLIGDDHDDVVLQFGDLGPPLTFGGIEECGRFTGSGLKHRWRVEASTKCIEEHLVKGVGGVHVIKTVLHINEDRERVCRIQGSDGNESFAQHLVFAKRHAQLVIDVPPGQNPLIHAPRT